MYDSRKSLLFLVLLTLVSKMLAGVIRVYVLAIGFSMLFYCRANILICFRLVFSPLRLPTFLLSPLYVNGSGTHFLYDSFQMLFCWLVLGFLENMTQCFEWFKSCLSVLAVQNLSYLFWHLFTCNTWNWHTVVHVCFWVLSWLWLCDVWLINQWSFQGSH